MSYVVPEGDNVILNFEGEYSVPQGDVVILNFGGTQEILLLCNLQTTDITTEGWTSNWEVCE